MCVRKVAERERKRKKERRVQNMISSITHGVGGITCVFLCVCECTSLATNVHCTARASPMITGIHSTQKHWPYRTSCNCNQPLTKLRAKTDRHSKWYDDDERRCKADGEELSGLGKVVAFVFWEIFFLPFFTSLVKKWGISHRCKIIITFQSSNLVKGLKKGFPPTTDQQSFATTNADQAAIRPEQSTALGSARSPLASLSLSLWPKIMWSVFAHGSSDVFPEEFDSNGGRENWKERGGREGGRRVTGY